MKVANQDSLQSIFKKLKGRSIDERMLHRLHSVALSLQGFSVRETARMYGDSPRSVAYWIKRFKASGIDGLREEAHMGRPPKLDQVQMKKLETVLLQSRKRSKPVTAAVMSAYVRKQFGVALTIRQCGRILHRLALKKTISY